MRATDMVDNTESESRKLLRRLRDSMAEESAGQERLNHITQIIAEEMRTEVCSIYLFRDSETLELCATEGLNPDSVHQTRMRLGEGLVGRVAQTAQAVNEADAPSAKGFRYMPETGEEVFSSFCGVPIQRLGDKLGVLVVQSREARAFSEERSLCRWKFVAMVLAEMAELGAFVGEGEALRARHTNPIMFRGGVGQEGVAEGHVYLHEPRVVVTNPVADDPETEVTRLREAVDTLRVSVDDMLESVRTGSGGQGSARGAGSLSHVRQFPILAAPDGRRHRGGPVGRSRRRKGTIRCPSATGANPAMPTCASGCRILTTCRTGYCAF